MDDGALNLRLHARQGLAFNTPANEVLYGGAAGGGKSHLWRVFLIIASNQVTGLQSYLFRRTYPELLSNHVFGPGGFLELLGGWIRRGWAKFNLSQLRIEFPRTRSSIHLCHCQYEKDVYSYQGRTPATSGTPG
jgi:hypothetical protein